MFSEKSSNVFIKRLRVFCVGLPIITYLIKVPIFSPVLVSVLLTYIFLAGLSLIFVPQKEEPFLNKIVYVVFGIWMALIHFSYISGFFSAFQTRWLTPQIINFLIAVFLGVLGVVAIFIIISRKEK